MNLVKPQHMIPIVPGETASMSMSLVLDLIVESGIMTGIGVPEVCEPW